MKQLIGDFDKLYPSFMTKVSDVCIEEKENIKKEYPTLRYLNIRGINGFEISNEIIKKSKSLFENVCPGYKFLKSDCDGIFLTEKDGRKYIFICELKSRFSVKEISSAKDQIIGSYLKLHALFSLLQTYRQEDYEIRGIIASFSPTSEVVSYMTKSRENNKASKFCYNLNRDSFYVMPKENCMLFYAPLCLQGLTIHYLPVLDNSPECSLQLDKLLQF